MESAVAVVAVSVDVDVDSASATTNTVVDAAAALVADHTDVNVNVNVNVAAGVTALSAPAKAGANGANAISQEELHYLLHGNADADAEDDEGDSPPLVISTCAPGKVLLAGGYLVLEQPNVGLVLAASNARFHTTLSIRPALTCKFLNQPKFQGKDRLTKMQYYLYHMDSEDEDEDGDNDNENNDNKKQQPCASSANITNGDETTTESPLLSLSLLPPLLPHPTCDWSAFKVDVYSPQFASVFGYWCIYLKDSNKDNTKNNTDTPASSLSSCDVIQLTPRFANQASNDFVEKTLTLTLLYVHETLGPAHFHAYIVEQQLHQHGQGSRSHSHGLAIQLRAENDFYSQIHTLTEVCGLELNPVNVAIALPPFWPCPILETKTTEDDSSSSQLQVQVHKTGMGSSAALVTSLVAALLQFFQQLESNSLPYKSLNDPQEVYRTRASQLYDHLKSRQKIHNLAQICHCLAQGKIGSGFDVSAACFGSHVYKRFSPHILSAVLDNNDNNNSNRHCRGQLLVELVNASNTNNTSTNKKESNNDTTTTTTKEAVPEASPAPTPTPIVWDQSVEPLQLPKGIQLVLADVRGGSESPSMARKVMAWKQKCESNESGDNNANNNIHKEQLAVWHKLAKLNALIQTSLECLHLLETEFANPLVRNQLASQTVKQWQVLAQAVNVNTVTTTNDNEGNEDEDEAPSSAAAPTTDITANDNVNNEDNIVDLIDQVDGQVLVLGTCAKALCQLHALIQKQRHLMKLLGQYANIDIEPTCQTQLANVTQQVPGVICAGVPGAGGMDALYVLYVEGEPTYGGALTSSSTGEDGDENATDNATDTAVPVSVSDTTRDRIGACWQQWNNTNHNNRDPQCEADNNDDDDEAGHIGSTSTMMVCPLSVKAGSFGGFDGVCETDLDW
jgi:phosphomevalonate kinase